MKRFARILTVGGALLLATGSTALAESSYLSLKGGVFLPNGKGDSSQGGFNNFDAGYNFELGVGFRPAPYAAIEVGTGFYSTSRDTVTAANQSESITAYGIPITATAKGILSFDKAELFAGAGAGYYFGLLNQKVTSPTQTVDRSLHGNALGYHLAGGFDFKLNEQFSLGADLKWFMARPDFTDLNDPSRKVKWDFGGTTMNVGAKYRF